MTRENKFKNYIIRFKASAEKDFKKLNKAAQRSIKEILDQFINNAANIDIKKCRVKKIPIELEKENLESFLKIIKVN